MNTMASDDHNILLQQLLLSLRVKELIVLASQRGRGREEGIGVSERGDWAKVLPGPRKGSLD